MKKNKYSPFNDLFYKYKINISSQELQQIQIFLKNFKEKKEQQTTTYNIVNILNLPLLKNLKKQIITILKKHKLILKNNWAQLYRKGDFHSKHVHANTCYAGVIYVNGSGKDGTLFHHPNGTLIESYGKRFKTQYLETFEPGTLILFPGFIEHEVLEQKSENDRTIISFNTIEEINSAAVQ